VVEWLPVLNPGVQVHFHDIYFPYDYSNSVLGGGGGSELFFWHETALLMAFLTMNPGFRILCCQSMLHHMCPKELQALFPSHQLQKNEDGVGLDDGAFAASLYLERLG
jgi:hypothetical protein